MRELETNFLQIVREGHYQVVGTIGEAHGIKFVCPKCYARNDLNRPGVHSIICWSRSRGAPEDEPPGPGRWRLDGTDVDDLSLNADPPSTARSIQLLSGCNWHGFVTNGYAHGDL